MNKKLLAIVWVAFAAGLLGLAGACGDSTDAPLGIGDVGKDAGNTTSKKDAGGSKGVDDHPPPRKVDDKPPPVDTDTAPTPTVTSVTPTTAVLNDVGPTITVNGALFVPRSKVLLDGTPLQTSFESDTALKATIPDDKLKAVAPLKISVTTAAPGGGTSSEVTFNVVNPKPELNGLDPLSVNTGANTTTLHITGKNFVPGVKVKFGTNDVPITLVSATQIDATVQSNLLINSGAVNVKVTNPFPGGGDSAVLAFTVSNPSSTITALTPATGIIGASSIPLSVAGSGFVEGTVINLNGTPLTTTFVASDKVTATIPGSALTTVGSLGVTVTTPPPGGGISAAVAFTVGYPVPSIDFITTTPSSLVAGGNPADVTINGSGYFDGISKITFNGAETNTTFVSKTQLKATLSAADLATAKIITVKVVNPAPGGGASTGKDLTVKNGTPAILSFNPASVDANSTDTVVEIIGSAFLAETTAKGRKAGDPIGNNVELVLSYTDSSHVSVTIKGSLLDTQGKEILVTLYNPQPGGGTSNSPSTSPRLQVKCDASDPANVSLINLTRVETRDLDFAGATTPIDKAKRWKQADKCSASALVDGQDQPFRFLSIQNTTTQPMVVNSWAKCATNKDDAFLSIYKGGTPPADVNDIAARKTCTGNVKEAGSPSADASGSSTCPGITKASESITLNACERAVVMIQSAKIEDTAAPPQLLFQGAAP